MSQVAPTEVLRLIIGIVAREGWRDNPSAVSELECLVLGDPLDAQFEFYGVPAAATVAQEVVVGEVRELILGTPSLPYRATVARDPQGNWKLKEFLTQCTGCLGSGEILGRPCASCSGTGWGLRPL
jgi:hypothetical protein